MSSGKAIGPRYLALPPPLLLAVLLILAVPNGLSAQEDYKFDPGEMDKPAFTWGGYFQALGAGQRLNQDAAQYRLQYFGSPRQQVDTDEGRVHLDLGYRVGWLGFTFSGEAWRTDTYTGTLTDSVVQEAYLTAQPSPAFTLDVGKRVAHWGKGYAWNPIAFVDRPKDPNDPQLAQEGFVMARAVAVKSLPGSLKTLELTIIDLPVRKDVNDDFGDKAADNAAAKLYALAWDTDIDFAVLSGGTRAWRYGADFSRNVTSNFEIHGEWATTTDAKQPVVDANSTVTLRTRTVQAWLAGVRYLTESELTVILEYYSNSAGYSSDELKNFYRFVDNAYVKFKSTGQTAALDKANDFAKGAYEQPTPGQKYGYLRASQQEPFGWLYVTPALTVIQNLQDGSYSATPELTYTRVTNLEVRVRISWLFGARFTDFGERPNVTRAEFRLRYAF